MDTGKLKSLATGARIQLMDGVRASLKRVLAPDSAETINERGHVDELRKEAKDEDALVERVAYTWFNRLCALRLMDSRGYTPVPVVTPRAGETMPAIIADARRGAFCADFQLKNADKQRVVALLSGSADSVNPLGEAYVILLLSACDYYAKPIPALFGADYRSTNAMRLLAPSSLLADDSVLQRIVEGMDDENCKEVEVMGWLYQFYIAELHDEICKGFSSKKKASPSDIAPATQLFTPHWIVRYMVDNSLGRLWMLNFPDSGLPDHMDCYIEPEELETDYPHIDSPEDITFLDPAMGSGHILVYAFDLLYDMYIEEGYRPAEIPTLILQNNLTGFEIDDRAAEIAIFALMVKARERDSEFFKHAIQPDVTVFRSIRFDSYELEDAGLIVGHSKLLDALAHLDEVGSLYHPASTDAVVLANASKNLAKQEGIIAGHALDSIEMATRTVQQLLRRFTVVAANPPYMGSGNMNAWLSNWIKTSYPDEKSDLCTCFMNRCLSFAADGLVAIITSEPWLTKVSFEAMRRKLYSSSTIYSLVHMTDSTKHADVFGANVSLVLSRQPPSTVHKFPTICTTALGAPSKERQLAEAIHHVKPAGMAFCDQCTLEKMPTAELAYKATKAVKDAYGKYPALSDIADVKKGLTTSKDELFLRYWWEVSESNSCLHDGTIASSRQRRWFPCSKGGSFRKWYGNNEYVVDWHHDGENLKNYPNAVIRNETYFFRECISWSDVSALGMSFRYKPRGGLFNDVGPSIFANKKTLLELLGLVNTTSAQRIIDAISISNKFTVGEVSKLPIASTNNTDHENLVLASITCAKEDWDSFETSWDFTRHALLCYYTSIEKAALETAVKWQNRFSQLKSNEEELNRIYARIYGLEGEVPIDVSDDRVSVRLFDREREIRSLISYAIGCMFGRYSLDKDGLILADQGSTIEDYLAKIPSPTFMPDEDGILPITEEEWFEDDIVIEFRRWLKVAFGAEYFDENLAYIEDTLDCKLREYFIKGKKSAFYDDHCKTYSVTGSGKRPIYWMFSSPKSSFNCLVYLHRYDDRTVSKILTDYVRELRRKLEVQARSLEASDIARDRTRAAKYHDMIDELNDWERDVLYPMAQRHIKINLDDGVRHNYKLFPGALRKVAGLS